MDKQNDLSGLSILITRPQPQAQLLANTVVALGAKPLVLPCVAIAPPPDLSQLARASQCIADYDMAIFISPSAVESSYPYLLQYSANLPQSLKVGCIGEGTAHALARLQIKVDFYPKPRFNSEELLALPELQNVSGKRIAIFKGVGGKPLLTDTLQARGAKVDEVISYQRLCPTVEVDDIMAYWHQQGINVVIATSQETLTNLLQILPESGQDLLKLTPLMVISPAMEQLAKQLQFKTVIVAENATEQAIVASLIQHRKEINGPGNYESTP
jgi:uroporphyrinogen-III synthase